ncbi:hypothetical protein EON66_07220 [archaeon]|nr:MAG: hypothetical protein EON66_07220 [archaeon]
MQIHDAAPPVLIFCRSGAAAFVLALLDSAQTRKATARQVHKWASQLGIDLEAHVDLLHIVSVLCHEWSADAHTYR